MVAWGVPNHSGGVRTRGSAALTVGDSHDAVNTGCKSLDGCAPSFHRQGSNCTVTGL
jgi:hypothetical protein